MDVPSSLSSSIILDEGSSEIAELERAVSEAGLKVSFGRFAYVEDRDLASFRYYQFGAKSSSAGFDLGGVFEKQCPCGLQSGRIPSGEALGCGIGKKQVRKILVDDSGVVAKIDLFTFRGLIVMPTGMFGVSRRFRDAMVSIGVTGMRFTPIIDDPKRWSPEQMEINSDADEEQERVARWFQLSIDVRSPAFLLERPLARERICTACGIHEGFEPLDPAWRKYSRSDLFDVDAQVMDSRIGSDGLEMSILGGALVVVSSRVLANVVANRLRGFAAGSGKWGKFRPLLMTNDAIES